MVEEQVVACLEGPVAGVVPDAQRWALDKTSAAVGVVRNLVPGKPALSLEIAELGGIPY